MVTPSWWPATSLILDTLRLAERLGISFDSPTIVLEREPRAENGGVAGKDVPLSSAVE